MWMCRFLNLYWMLMCVNLSSGRLLSPENFYRFWRTRHYKPSWGTLTYLCWNLYWSNVNVCKSFCRSFAIAGELLQILKDLSLQAVMGNVDVSVLEFILNVNVCKSFCRSFAIAGELLQILKDPSLQAVMGNIDVSVLEFILQVYNEQQKGNVTANMEVFKRGFQDYVLIAKISPG